MQRGILPFLVVEDSVGREKVRYWEKMLPGRGSERVTRAKRKMDARQGDGREVEVTTAPV